MRMTLDFELNRVTYDGVLDNVIDMPDLYKKKEQIYKVLGVEELTFSEINALFQEFFEDSRESIEEE